MFSVLIKNTTIIDPNSPFHNQKKDILVKDGIIIRIETEIVENKVDQIIEDNLHICPGLFDFSVDFPEPGNEQKETLQSGYKSSISGGFTAVGLQPTQNPSRDHKADILFCVNAAKKSGINVIPYGAISKGLQGEQLSEMFDMFSSGALAFSDNMNPVKHAGLFSRAVLYAKNFNGLIKQISLRSGC